MQSEENKELIRAMPCAACNKPGPSDPDHIRTRGAGGTDELHNLLPLCRQCHTARHQMGLHGLIKRHPQLMSTLDNKGWIFDRSQSRWINEHKGT